MAVARTGQDARRHDRPRGKLLLWTGFLLPAFAFLLNLEVSYGLVPAACHAGGIEWPIHLANLVCFLLAAGAGWTAWRDWRRMGRAWPDDAVGVEPRSRFLAALGVLSGGFFALVIAATWLGTVILNPCTGL
ncbi:MAG TPA: hypothetical protein VFQ39_12330 [Longimicrobium sp.]|nr:hypothetical protein [Longimicrobium sp.]